MISDKVPLSATINQQGYLSSSALELSKQVKRIEDKTEFHLEKMALGLNGHLRSTGVIAEDAKIFFVENVKSFDTDRCWMFLVYEKETECFLRFLRKWAEKGQKGWTTIFDSEKGKHFSKRWYGHFNLPNSSELEIETSSFYMDVSNVVKEHFKWMEFKVVVTVMEDE